ncbi:hypothetical protein SSTU70S_02971 [Stutzerimonas stutzeri]
MSNAEKVTIHCYGGCGRYITLRRSKVCNAHFYLCHSRQDGHKCLSKLPTLAAGMVRVCEMNAAAHFWGYRDEWPDNETAASVMRAREILAAGIAQMAIEKARKCI